MYIYISSVTAFKLTQCFFLENCFRWHVRCIVKWDANEFPISVYKLLVLISVAHISLNGSLGYAFLCSSLTHIFKCGSLIHEISK